MIVFCVSGSPVGLRLLQNVQLVIASKVGNYSWVMNDFQNICKNLPSSGKIFKQHCPTPKYTVSNYIELKAHASCSGKVLDISTNSKDCVLHHLRHQASQIPFILHHYCRSWLIWLCIYSSASSVGVGRRTTKIRE